MIVAVDLVRCRLKDHSACRCDYKEEWMDLKVGDVIKMKKSHPCGTNAWELRRVGMDIRIRCTDAATR